MEKLNAGVIKRDLEILNKNKVAYLYSKNLYETDVKKICRNGVEQFAFVYAPTQEVLKVLKSYDENIELKKFLNNFNSINAVIRKMRVQDC